MRQDKRLLNKQNGKLNLQMPYGMLVKASPCDLLENRMTMH